jgi:1-acyl-sn-glycerol-3-phosphate acyltransferase
MTVYGVVRTTCWLVFSTFYRLRAFGTENVPADGPVIVASNHRSYLDPPIVACVLRRPVSYMAKEELFRLPILGSLLPHIEAFPVDRKRGDVSAVKRALSILKQGKVIGIFPEGTRNRDGRVPAQTGVALLAALSGAPVVPAFVSGTDAARRLGRLTVTFGAPLRFGRSPGAGRALLEKWRDEIMEKIVELGKESGAPAREISLGH